MTDNINDEIISGYSDERAMQIEKRRIVTRYERAEWNLRNYIFGVDIPINGIIWSASQI